MYTKNDNLQSMIPELIIEALDGGPLCRMSNFRNGNVPCPYFCNIHVDFKIVSCRMSNIRNCPYHVTNIFPHADRIMSHVDFKKWPCRPVEFKGQGPHHWSEQNISFLKKTSFFIDYGQTCTYVHTTSYA